MHLLTLIRTNYYLKIMARFLEKRMKRYLLGGIRYILKAPAPETIDSLVGIEKILIIRPNFRLGNALISTPVIDAFRKRFPSARIDYLATDKTWPLLQQRPVDHFHLLSRAAILRPWQCVTLLRRLRAQRYDLAVQVSGGSTSGFIVTRLIGARYSMGSRKGHQRWYSIEAEGKSSHAYDAIVNLTRPLGVTCRNRPLLQLTEQERYQAITKIRQLFSLHSDHSSDTDFIAIFVGGHQNKRWPLAFWLMLIDAMEACKIRYVVFLGPEEFRLLAPIEQRLMSSQYGSLCPPLPIRHFAAVLERASLLVTPDSGPMHLAAALDVATISLVRQKKSLAFVPREPYDTILWRPEISTIVEAIQANLEGRASTTPVHANSAAGQPKQCLTPSPNTTHTYAS
ncbi:MULTISPECIES: glycosyltransferase family 9 protein [unclassified Halomonas]|uniref:glycosyltransferase family 9 protein n=1 Tax=unclassified Halomonas TaxID=2609666 RepID=UPI00054DA312|nr:MULTISPECIES: glycosyltransferase family 9 protein [unclassified Halomonas]MBR9904120.1 glycosyltransferase family 9 protein [Gammaproteobacteria bacterium]